MGRPHPLGQRTRRAGGVRESTTKLWIEAGQARGRGVRTEGRQQQGSVVAQLSVVPRREHRPRRGAIGLCRCGRSFVALREPARASQGRYTRLCPGMYNEQAFILRSHTRCLVVESVALHACHDKSALWRLCQSRAPVRSALQARQHADCDIQETHDPHRL